jgi:hypothetical protein
MFEKVIGGRALELFERMIIAMERIATSLEGEPE